MNILDLRDTKIGDYLDVIRGFVNIRDALVRQEVDRALDEGRLWPEPWLSLNPKFEPGGTIGDPVSDGVLHPECDRIFRLKTDAELRGQELNLYRHQASARPNAALAFPPLADSAPLRSVRRTGAVRRR
jgi:hypothetical protein